MKDPKFLPKGNFIKIITRKYHTGATNQLGYYIAGLIEEDGSIIFRKGEKEKISPKIVFIFGKNEISHFKNYKKFLIQEPYMKKKEECVDII